MHDGDLLLHSTAPGGAAALASGESRPRLDRQLDALDRLADAGLDMARALADQAQGTGPQVVEGDVALAYSRVARAVRMAVLLQSRLAADEAASRKPAADPAVERDNDLYRQEQGRKARVERIVGRICQGDAEEDVEQCMLEAGERLDDDDLYGDILARPISDLVAQVCKDLGLDPDWPALAQEPWARREIESGQVGEPLMAYLPCAAAEGASGAPTLSAAPRPDSS